MGKTKIFLLMIFILFGFFVFEKANAGAGDNTSGWAWSENIGWISFNCNNPELPAPRCTYNYGVNASPLDGKLSGYAWSENIGWISFNESDTGAPPSNDPCPDASCIAKLQDSGQVGKSNVNVLGWARVCAAAPDPSTCGGGVGANPNAGGWDGWIRFDHGQSGQVYVDINGDFHGWAWSSEVIGWISFNSSDPGAGGAAYKVILDVSTFNQPPVAGICCQSCASPNCTAYTGDAFTLINNSSDLNGLADIVKSKWDISQTVESPDFDCCSSGCDSTDPLCKFAPQPQILGRGNYTVELYVEDLAGASDTETKLFTIVQDAIADFKCSLDNLSADSPDWKTCETIRPSLGEKVYFLDQSTPSDGATILNRSWTFQNGTPDTATGTNPSTTFQSAGEKDVVLTITDNADRSDSQTHYITITLPLPEWEEIPPF